MIITSVRQASASEMASEIDRRGAAIEKLEAERDGLLDALTAAEARIAGLEAVISSGETLSLALSRYGFPMSDEAWRNTGDDAPVNSQASVEARALHRAALAFFREVSGAREALSRQEGGR